MSSTDTPSTTTSDSSPKFPSKEWFLKNKVLVGIVVIVVLLGTGVGIYFAVRPKSGTAGGEGSGGAGGLTDTGARKNGKWSNWSAECVKQGDQWVKTRTCLEEGKNGGLLCSQIDGGKTTQICEAIPGGWRTPADSDAVCKLEDGKWMKERFCDDPAPKYGGATCSGSNKVECTPQNGYWTPSFNETTCKVETDAQGKPIVDSTGRTNYYKTITCIDPQYGGSPCPARTETGVVVSGGKARIKCGHTDGVWTQFSTCALDNSDNSVKTRTCTLPTLGGLPCVDYYPLMNLVNDDDSGYVVSASSVHPAEAWKASRAFDGNIQTCWHSNEQSSSNLYDSLDGTYKGATLTTAGNGTAYRGEWIQIQFPPSTIHTRFQAVGIKITPRQDAWSTRSPRNFVLLGSNPSTLTNITSWTVIYDNTLLDGIKDWTASAKTIYFPTSASSGYTIYRLVITRVGNTSVQIAELKIIGTPFVTADSTGKLPLQVEEKIPCNQDCRVSDWKPACEKSGDAWKQNRDIVSQPVGTGKSCPTLTRNCPGTATNWSAWGAFKVNNSNQSTGTVSQFVNKSSYTDTDGKSKQVRYIQLGDNQGCPSDSTSVVGNMCYQVRNLWTEYSECSLPDPNGSWIQTRTNLETNEKDNRACTMTPTWGKPPDYQFRVKVNNTDWRLSADCGIGNACQIEHRNNGMHGRGFVCMKAQQDRGQIFRSGAGLGWTGEKQNYIQIDKSNAVYDACVTGDGCTLDFVPWCRNWQDPNKGSRLVINGSALSAKDDSTNAWEYAPNTKQFRLKSNFDDNLRCLTSLGNYGDSNTIGLAVCDPNDKNQRFEAIPR